MNPLGKKIVNLLDKQNMTQKELAEKVGVSEITISRYINGSREPKSNILCDIASTLGVSMDYLLGNVPQLEIDEDYFNETDLVKNLENILKNLSSGKAIINGQKIDDYNSELIKIQVKSMLNQIKLQQDKFNKPQ